MKERILIVDDQPENLMMLSESLKDEYSISIVNSGTKALEFITKEHIPDLVLLDIVMPDMNGFELCKKIKEYPKSSSIPVIFVTVMGAIEDIKKGFEAGGVDYITKPYRIEEVRARVGAHLKLLKQQKELISLIDELQSSQALNIEQARLGASIELLKNIAHHWRQPLTVAMVATDNMVDACKNHDIEDEKFDSQTKLIKDSLKKISNMISEFSRLFSVHDAMEIFNVKEALTHALKFVGGTLEVENITQNIETDDDCCVKGYKNEYIHVLLMILSNAIEMLNIRHIRDKHIWIKLQKLEDGKSRLSIKDNAGGIDPDIMSRIFEPYISHKFPTFGIGLNLFTSKILIEKHMGGSMEAKNSDTGAEFVITI